MTASQYFTNKNFYAVYSDINSTLIRKAELSSSVKYSIIIPTYGRAELLKDAVTSCIRQTYTSEFEILIVDNDPVGENATELMLREIKDKRITYYKNNVNIGCLPNFNRCIELAAGEYLIMLHTDDLLDSDFLQKIIPLIEENPQIDMLIPGKRIIKNEMLFKQKGLAYLSRILGLTKRAVPLSVSDFSYYNIVGGPLGIVMKKDKCLKLGGFDEEIFPVSDYAFWVRVAKSLNIYYLPKELGTYRFYGNISSEKGMQLRYIENEYLLINALINNDIENKRMSGYLYEYIRYRTQISQLDSNAVFSKLTGSEYKMKLSNKVHFVSSVINLSFSYIRKAMKSRIRI